MIQRIYDTRQQALVDFEPITAGLVGMYVCGPTVQSSPHVGHLRSALVYDQMRRWFAATGHHVRFIRNVTDIDDKILEHARTGGQQEQTRQSPAPPEPWWALAYRIEREFTAAYDAIGVLPPVYEPRATAHIAEMIALITRLVERGHAYQATDGSANVYFDAASWGQYGALTRQSGAELHDAAEGDARGKRNTRDFALWKAHRDHEPLSASWGSPWGRGRPGWHIECSAMATRYLGQQFDIHGGGLDLRFPHHENELAQSAAAGHQFARYWLHNGLVHTGGQKMSKSLGNSLFAHDLLAASRPIVLRYLLGAAHYRSVLELSSGSLAEAARAFARIERFLENAEQHLTRAWAAANSQLSVPLMPAPLNGTATSDMLPAAFRQAMFDDFGVPQALAALHHAVRVGNTAMSAGDTDRVLSCATEVVAMLDVLGLDPRARLWQRGATEHAASGAGQLREREVLDRLVTDLLAERRAARSNKDFVTSDSIRERLTAVGITLEDGTHDTNWSLT